MIWPNRRTLLAKITCRDEPQWQAIMDEWETIERMGNVVLVEVGVRGGKACVREGWQDVWTGGAA